MKNFTLKTFAVAFTAASLILSSCSKDDSKKDDSTGNVEVFSSTKTALFLYYTGSECNPCGSTGIPNYNAVTKDVNLKSKVIGIAVHCNAPRPDSMYNDAAGNELLKLIVENNTYSAPTFLIPPNAKFLGNASTAKTMASTYVNTFSSPAPVVGINASATIMGGIYNIKTRVKFLTADSGQYKVAVLPLEDGVKYHQIVNGAIVQNYIHDEVLRGKFSVSVFGDEIKVGKVDAGTIIEKVHMGSAPLTIPVGSVNYWNKANMSAVVIVWKHTKVGTTNLVEVMNCQKIKLPVE